MSPNDDLEPLLALYCAGPGQLRAALQDLAGADLDQALDDHSWTIRQYVHHVVDGDALWKMGLLAALGEVKSFDLAWYWSMPQDRWAEYWSYAARPLEPSLSCFEANRQHTADLLRAIPAALERQMTVNWPGRSAQPISVRAILEMQTRHVDGHIADIQRIRALKGDGSRG